MNVRLIDSHAHLDFPAPQELRAVLERARGVGVSEILQIVCLGQEGDPLEAALRRADEEPGLWVAAGVHPHDAGALTPELERQIEASAPHPRFVACGEIGLDFFYENAPRDVQQEAFARQLLLARRLAKPVIIHSREAARETCRLLEEDYTSGPNRGGVMHCFTYDWPVAEHCLEMGFHLGFGGIVTFPKAEPLREVARRVPEDRFLIETDSPYLAPVPHRGKTNEPAFVVKVAEKLAEVRGTTLETIAQQSTRNFQRLFGSGGRPGG